MKVHVDTDLCAGFGICVGICPEVFELHDDGYATVLPSEVPPELQDLVRRAASQCPAQAIFITDD
ncbi:ferredoxin [Novosphingobium sp. ST904]|jgi:ferredoxin|uniref:ferredoxin n=1 Tax=Novosphingobium sp. ST904 TaxID=1684385 RepID=UPI0006C8B8FD|nr:ferredoxin [Novosphingobium sp. ST904]KPH66802.1 ferredoxin [Novosphingobium sp. ST904]TCM28397.1 ferredoxin [Novosphingobium sp. ST904]